MLPLISLCRNKTLNRHRRSSSLSQDFKWQIGGEETLKQALQCYKIKFQLILHTGQTQPIGVSVSSPHRPPYDMQKAVRTSIFWSCSTVWLATLMPLISRISSPTCNVPGVGEGHQSRQTPHLQVALSSCIPSNSNRPDARAASLSITTHLPL